MEFITKPIIVGLSTGVFAVLISLIENKINNKNRNKKDYLKVFISVLVLYLIGNYLYENNYKNTNNLEIKGGNKKIIENDNIIFSKTDDVLSSIDEISTGEINEITIIDKIDTGLPDF